MTAFDEQSSSLIKLNNSTVLYLREVNKFLALVCILREYSFSRQGVIDFNFLCFREAIHKVFEIRTTKKCALDDSIYDDEDVDNEEVEDEEDECIDNEHDSRHSLHLQRYESDEDIKLGMNSRVNNHNYRSPVTNH